MVGEVVPVKAIGGCLGRRCGDHFFAACSECCESESQSDFLAATAGDLQEKMGLAPYFGPNESSKLLHCITIPKWGQAV